MATPTKRNTENWPTTTPTQQFITCLLVLRHYHVQASRQHTAQQRRQSVQTIVTDTSCLGPVRSALRLLQPRPEFPTDCSSYIFKQNKDGQSSGTETTNVHEEEEEAE